MVVVANSFITVEEFVVGSVLGSVVYGGVVCGCGGVVGGRVMMVSGGQV